MYELGNLVAFNFVYHRNGSCGYRYITMTDERYNEISNNENVALTKEEIAEGWHFCYEFDGLLVKGDPKEEFCGKACIGWNGSL